MRRFLNAFLIGSFIAVIIIGHNFLQDPEEFSEIQLSDLFIDTTTPNYHLNQTLADDYIGNDQAPLSQFALSGDKAPFKLKKEEKKQIIQEVAEDSIVDWRDLWILAKYESRWDTEAKRINHHEESYGLYQINTKVHNVTPEEAKDIEFATEWTIDNLLENGYTESYVIIPLARHQGSPNIPRVINRANEIYYEARSIPRGN